VTVRLARLVNVLTYLLKFELEHEMVDIIDDPKRKKLDGAYIIMSVGGNSVPAGEMYNLPDVIH